MNYIIENNIIKISYTKYGLIEIKNSTAPTLSQFTKWAEATLKQLNQDDTNATIEFDAPNGERITSYFRTDISAIYDFNLLSEFLLFLLLLQ